MNQKYLEDGNQIKKSITTLEDTVLFLKNQQLDLFINADTVNFLGKIGIDYSKLSRAVQRSIIYLNDSIRIPKPNTRGSKYAEAGLFAMLDNGSLQKYKAVIKDSKIISNGYRSEGPNGLFNSSCLCTASKVFITLNFIVALKYECNAMHSIALIKVSNIYNLFDQVLAKNKKVELVLSEDLLENHTFLKRKKEIEDKAKSLGIKISY